MSTLVGWDKGLPYKTTFKKAVNSDLLIIPNDRGREVGPSITFVPSATGVEGLEMFPVLGIESTSLPVDDSR